jgi:hypothetical protein
LRKLAEAAEWSGYFGLSRTLIDDDSKKTEWCITFVRFVNEMAANELRLGSRK